MISAREQIYNEIDIIAERYKWERDTIMRLPVSERKWYIERIKERYEKENAKNRG